MTTPNEPSPRTIALHRNAMHAALGLPPLEVPGDPARDPLLAQLQAIGRAVGVPAEPVTPPPVRQYRPLPRQDQVDDALARMLADANHPGAHQRVAVDPAQAHVQRQALVAAAQERGRQLAQDAAGAVNAAVAGPGPGVAGQATVADLQARLQANREALAALDATAGHDTPPPAA